MEGENAARTRAPDEILADLNAAIEAVYQPSGILPDLVCIGGVYYRRDGDRNSSSTT